MYTIAFDLDDTLYEKSQPLKKVFLELECSENTSFNYFHKLFQVNSDIAFEKVRKGKWTLKESHIFRVKETLKQLDIFIDEEAAQSFQTLYEKNQQQIELSPFILDIIQFLQKKRIQTIIITNGPVDHQRNKVKNLGLDNYFDLEEIIVSAEEGVAKPNEQIFKIAENRFNLNKHKTWYIGDDYANDIIGATHAGWHSIWLNTENVKKDKNIATKTVTSTLQLKQLLYETFQ